MGMELNITRRQGEDMNTSETYEARMWDSERHDSPYSTVASQNDDDYCEHCDQTVNYSTSDAGECGCE